MSDVQTAGAEGSAAPAAGPVDAFTASTDHMWATIDGMVEGAIALLPNLAIAALVHVVELGDSAVMLRARWWSDTSESTSVRSRVVAGLKKALDGAAIDMPYPTQVTLLRPPGTGEESPQARQGRLATA